MTIFEGSAVALVLPMFDNGDIDFEGFKRQVQRMIDGIPVLRPELCSGNS